MLTKILQKLPRSIAVATLTIIVFATATLPVYAGPTCGSSGGGC